MIYIIGIIITSFLSFLLLTKKGKSIADTILFIWLCLILVHLILYSIISSNEYLKFPYLLGLEIPLPLLHGPFLYLYTLTLTSQQDIRPKILLHFLPYAIAFIAIIPFLFLSPDEKILVYQKKGKGFETIVTIIFVGIILSGITYTILSLLVLRRYKIQLKNNFSYIERINLLWLFRIILSLSCIWFLVLFADDKIIFSSVVLFVVLIGYYGIKQVGVFSNQPPLAAFVFSKSTEEIELLDTPLSNIKYENSLLPEDQSQEIHQRLVHIMKEKKLYQIPELTLAMVSEELNVHPNRLSQVINSVEQKNFFDYINYLRIEEFKKLLANPENQKYTILSLALECGFNSKTSFNRNFKNQTGISPSAYLREIKKVSN